MLENNPLTDKQALLLVMHSVWLATTFRGMTLSQRKSRIESLLRSGQYGCNLVACAMGIFGSLKAEEVMYLSTYYSEVSCIN